MTLILQQGESATIELKFLNVDGSVALAPTSGGSVSSAAGLQYGTITLADDQKTVTYTASGHSLGTETIFYNGPDGLTASDNIIIVATTAVSVSFDESTFTLITG